MSWKPTYWICPIGCAHIVEDEYVYDDTICPYCKGKLCLAE